MVIRGALSNWVGLSNCFNTRLMPLRRIFLHRHDLSFKLLRESTSYFGYNPRQCFDASSSAAKLTAKKSQVASRISVATSRPSYDIIQLLRNTRGGGSDVSHTIFQISPTPTDTYRLFSNCQFGPVSRWALDLLLRQHETREADATADFYYYISVTSDVGLLRGPLFERLALNHLRDIRTECTFSIRGLAVDSNQMPWTYCGPECVTFEESTAFQKISEAVQYRKSLHLIPLACNFVAVDSIIYDPNEEGLTCIQTTEIGRASCRERV